MHSQKNIKEERKPDTLIMQKFFYGQIITDISTHTSAETSANVNPVFLVDRSSLWQVYFQDFGFFPVRIIPPTSQTDSIVSRRRDAISAIKSVANNTFKRTTSYCRRSESSSALLWGPYTSQRMRFLHAKCLFHGEFNYDSHPSFITSPLLHHLFIRNLFALFQ